MTFFKILPCKCINPQCGHQFNINNPIVGDNLKNFSFQGNFTKCPKCTSKARISDFDTDFKGNSNLRGFSDEILGINNIEKLNDLKRDLESNRNRIAPSDLAIKLAEVEPALTQYRDFINSIPPHFIPNFITLIINAITMATVILTTYFSEIQHDENMSNFDEQLQLSKDQFEYQKKRDQINDQLFSRQEHILNKMREMEMEFERAMKESERTRELDNKELD